MRKFFLPKNKMKSSRAGGGAPRGKLLEQFKTTARAACFFAPTVFGAVLNVPG